MPASIHLSQSLMFGLLLASCSLMDPNRPLPKREYGQRTTRTISVTVEGGFKKPGVYQVLPGTTLGDVINMAHMLPNPEKGTELGLWSLSLKQSEHKFNSFKMISDRMLRMELRDQGRLCVKKYNY